MFDSDSADEDDFLGFQDCWKFDNLNLTICTDEGQPHISIQRVVLPLCIHPKLRLRSIFFCFGPRKYGNTLFSDAAMAAITGLPSGPLIVCRGYAASLYTSLVWIVLIG